MSFCIKLYNPHLTLLQKTHLKVIWRMFPVFSVDCNLRKVRVFTYLFDKFHEFSRNKSSTTIELTWTSSMYGMCRWIYGLLSIQHSPNFHFYWAGDYWIERSLSVSTFSFLNIKDANINMVFPISYPLYITFIFHIINKNIHALMFLNYFLIFDMN